MEQQFLDKNLSKNYDQKPNQKYVNILQIVPVHDSTDLWIVECGKYYNL